MFKVVYYVNEKSKRYAITARLQPDHTADLVQHGMEEDGYMKKGFDGEFTADGAKSMVESLRDGFREKGFKEVAPKSCIF